MSVTIYVEGGGDDNEALRTRCREGFSKFFERAGFKGHMPRVVACGGRGAAFDRFTTAMGMAKAGQTVILLVDSEAPVKLDPSTKKPVDSWQHLKAQAKWTQPPGATSDQAQLMVQTMEAWFFADVDCVKAYYGAGFKEDKMKIRADVEDIDKATLYRELKDATKDTKTKGEYDKGGHSFDLLGRLDPLKVRKKSAHAARLLDLLKTLLLS